MEDDRSPVQGFGTFLVGTFLTTTLIGGAIGVIEALLYNTPKWQWSLALTHGGIGLAAGAFAGLCLMGFLLGCGIVVWSLIAIFGPRNHY